MKIYTKKGDRGETSTFLGKMSKGDELAEVLGSLDEVNSWMGLCRATSPLAFPSPNFWRGVGVRWNIDKDLKRIQTNLMTIISILAGSDLKFRNNEVRKLERLIDKLNEDLPEIKHFIYPVGYLQVARAVCRRAERRVAGFMIHDSGFMNKSVMKYLNRLSDALFVMGRWVNFKNGVREEEWKK